MADNRRRRRWSGSGWLLVLTAWAAIVPVAGAPVFDGPIGPLAQGGRYTATADLNHDGHLDLAGVLNATDEVSVLLGTGTGTFSSNLRFPVGDQPFATAIGDFNEDGHPDLVVSNLEDASILLGNGDGSFQPETRLLIPQFRIGREPAVGDLNDDGHLDIVLPQRLFALITILLGRGDGTFEAASQFPTVQTSRHRTVVIGDLDEDTVPDLVLGNEGCCRPFEVFLGDGEGGFGPAQGFETAAIPISLALADLDGDEHLDVVATGWGTLPPAGLSILPGKGNGEFEPFTETTPRDRDSVAVAAADFNQDARIDVAVTEHSNATGWAGVTILLGVGDGTLEFREEFEIETGYLDYILVGDFDEDTLPDLIVSADTDGPVLFLNQGPHFPPGFVDDSDRDDPLFGVDHPPVCDATDIDVVETSISLCDFQCGGGPDLCCGPDSGGEGALIVHMEMIGASSPPKLDQGEFNLFLDFGEAIALHDDPSTSLSLRDAVDEPGVGPRDTSDLRFRAAFGQGSASNRGGRYGIEARFSASRRLKPRVGLLSRAHQATGAIDFVLPLDAIFAVADEEQRAAAGIGDEGSDSVDFLLWWTSRCQGNVVDRVPNTNDHDAPSIRAEVSPFSVAFRRLELLGPDLTSKPVDFRGADECGGGDGDDFLIGTQSPPQLLTIRNPSFEPMTVHEVSFSQPAFSTTAVFPIVVPGLGGEVSIPVSFQPTVAGPVIVNVALVADDPTPPSLVLLGHGFPDDPPVLGSCIAGSGAVVEREPFAIMVPVSDSAGLANIVSCSATARRTGGTGSIVFPLTDNGFDVSDVACDGTYVHTQQTGTLLGPGRWVFQTECTDRQGHLAAGPSCELVVQQDRDGDGIPDVDDPCPLDPGNDLDQDGLCGSSDNCPLVRNNGAPSNGFAGGTGDSCLDQGAPHCLRLDFFGFPDVPLCVDATGNNDLTECTSDSDCTVTPGFDTCAEVPAVRCIDRAIQTFFSLCRLGPAAFDGFGVGFPNVEFDNADCHAHEPPGCVSDETGALISQGCAPGDSCGTDIQLDSDGDGIGDACDPD